MSCALVTAIGSFSADIVIKNLKKKGFRVIGCDTHPKEWIVDAYQVNVFYQIPDTTQEERYIDYIQNLCLDEEIEYVLPLTDIEVDVFNKHRDWFEKNKIMLCISPQKTIDICRDKMAAAHFIDHHGFGIKTIQTRYMKDIENEPTEYPVVCKPFDGRSSQGLKYVYSSDDWHAFVRAGNLEKYIVQPLIKGDVVTVDIVRGEESECIAVPRKELIRTLNGAGTSVYVYHDAGLEKQCRKLADLLGVIGCVNFEFILDKNNQYHFIECNPRFAGGVEFTCIAGYDCVSNHMRAFQGVPIDGFTLYHNQYIARKYEEYVTCIE